MSKQAINRIALNLLEATVTLYPALPDGAPLLDSPIWSGVEAEGLSVQERWLSVATRPSGAAQPRQHNLIPLYELSIDRVWALPLEQLAGFHPVYSEYVLDVVWLEEETLQWHRRTFYGVTFNERSLSAREIDNGFTDGQQMGARQMTPSAGEYPVPPISAQLPYQVMWVGPDGQTPLYNYNPATAAFTAINTTAGRATVGYTGSAFRIEFADYPVALETIASGLGATAFMEAMPAARDLPRLDFLYGTRRLASVKPDGLWARTFVESATPATGAGAFVLKFGGTVVASLQAAGVEALAFTEL